MNNMDRYTIYCTEEQTRKALELGARMMLFWEDIKENYDDMPYCEISPRRDKLGIICNYAVIPTAEQMIGWLEEQGFYFGLDSTGGHVEIDFHCLCEKRGGSRKDATLCVIDAALDYLIKNKK